MRALRALAPAVIAAAALSACDDDSPMAPGAAGTLTVQLTDSPFSDAQSLLVTFSEVAAHMTEGELSPVPFVDGATSRTCDLKKLNGAQDVLGTGALTPGHYTQIRLVISGATLHFDNAASGPPCGPTIAAPPGRSAPVEIPSTIVRLNREFDVTNDAGTTIILDFDGDRSVKEAGNGRFIMTPVIAVADVQ